MNLPVEKLNRDEIYSFLCGLLVGLGWHLHFQRIGWVDSADDLLDPSLIFAWLLATGAVYILYVILYTIVEQGIEPKMKRKELHSSAFWAGYIEARKTLLHIFGVLPAAIILVAWPIYAFMSAKLAVSWLIVGAAVYVGLWAAAFTMSCKIQHELVWIHTSIDEGDAFTLDQAEYNSSRGKLSAELDHAAYVARLATENRDGEE
jgi:hypothetical protein